MGQSEWNAGTSSVGDVISNLKPVAGELKWPIFGLYLVACVLGFIAMGGVAMAAAPLLGPLESEQEASMVLMAVTLPVGWLLGGTLMYSMLGTGRRALLEQNRAGGFFAACADTLRRTPKVFGAILVVTIAQCMLICLPGLVFMALSPVPYLAATRDDLSITDTFWEGIGWLKRHIVTLGGSFALVTLVYAAAYVSMWVILALLTVGISQVAGDGALMGPVALGVIGFICLQLFNFTGFASALYTIDAAESGLTLNPSE